MKSVWDIKIQGFVNLMHFDIEGAIDHAHKMANETFDSYQHEEGEKAARSAIEAFFGEGS